jgi:hypothetical protein
LSVIDINLNARSGWRKTVKLVSFDPVSWDKSRIRGGSQMIRAVLVVGVIGLASEAVAKERPALAKDVVKGCEVTATSAAYLFGNGKGVAPSLKHSADLCVQVTQDILSKAADNQQSSRQPLVP